VQTRAQKAVGQLVRVARHGRRNQIEQHAARTCGGQDRRLWRVKEKREGGGIGVGVGGSGVGGGGGI
jgi:hypothetical protein